MLKEGISSKISYTLNEFQPIVEIHTPSLMYITRIKCTCDSQTPDKPVPSGRNYLIVSIIENTHLIGMPPCASGIANLKDSATSLLFVRKLPLPASGHYVPECEWLQFRKSSL